MNISDFLDMTKWWFVFFLIGVTFFPLTAKIFDKFLDRGYVFSKFLGLIFISYTIYILSSIHILKFNQINIVLVWVILSLISLLILKRGKFELKKFTKIIIAEELIFLIMLVIWSYIKGFNPEIHNLEKFMDFGFLNSILRTDYFPPRDMWFTPLPINYYYFGHLYTAVVTKLTNIPSFVTFNLMLATIFAFTFSLAFSIGINLVGKIRKYSQILVIIVGLLFGYIVSLSGNLHTIFSLFKPYNVESPVPFWQLVFSPSTFPNSYWYPNATRFIYNTIHEFPSYSFVVADLHGHVLSIPIVLTIIAVILLVFFEKKISFSKTILLGFLTSVAFMTNALDGLMYLVLILFAIFSLNLIFERGSIKKRILDSFILLIKHGVLLLFVFLSLTFIFNQNFSPFSTEIGVNCSPKQLVDIGQIGPFLFENGKCQTSPPWQFLTLWGFFIFMVTSLVIFLRKKSFLISDYFVIVISLFSILLIIIPEFFYFKDIYEGHFRANTMFKLGYQAFIMLSISSIYILVRILTHVKESIRNFKKPYINLVGYALFITASAVFVILVSFYPYFAVPAGYKDLRINEGLNGTTYLKSIKPEDYSAIEWINKNISGQPVILEAQGDSYTDYNRISANTGLPTVVGWTVHEWLWRGGYEIPSSRFDDVKNLYESRDVELTRNILKKYNIFYVYVGGLEKEKYKINEGKFQQLGTSVFSDNGTTIYKINPAPF